MLGEFLKHIQANPEEADLEKMVNILILHSQAQGKMERFSNNFFAVSMMSGFHYRRSAPVHFAFMAERISQP